jgi:hypothetical protein
MATGGAVTYEVTTVVPETQYNQTGTAVPGKRVSFKMSTGYEGGVFIPDSVFADHAALVGIIEGEVKLVAAAQSISGSVS